MFAELKPTAFLLITSVVLVKGSSVGTNQGFEEEKDEIGFQISFFYNSSVGQTR